MLQDRFHGGQSLPDLIRSWFVEGATCPGQHTQRRAAFDAPKYFSQDLVQVEAQMHDDDDGGEQQLEIDHPILGL